MGAIKNVVGLDMTTNKISNLGNPTAAQDAVTQAYVTGLFTKGAGFPASPVDGQLHYGASNRMWFEYDGASGLWLSTSVENVAMHNYRDAPPFSTTSEALACGMPNDGTTYYIESWKVGFFNDGANDATNYWTFTLRKLDEASSVLNIATMNTSALTGGSWLNLNATSFDATNRKGAEADIWLQLFIDVVGAPGPIYFTNNVNARRMLY